MKHKQLTVPVASFKVLDDEQGIAEHIVSVFNNKDSAKDRVKVGFFFHDMMLKSVHTGEPKKPKGVWMHDWSRPVAKTLDWAELAPGDSKLPDSIQPLGGLWVKAQYNLNVPDGRDMWEHLKFGTVDEFSFGYDVLEEQYNAKDRCNDLIKGVIYEWSPVLLGCNDATVNLDMKDLKSMLTKALEKSQYLGAYAEADMTWAALRSLNDDLFYWVVYDCLFPYGDTPEEERLATLEGALNEFAQIAIAWCRQAAAMAGADEDGEGVKTLQSTLRALWPSRKDRDGKPKENSGAARAAGPFNEQLATALAAVEGCIERGKSIQELRAQEGRDISAESREKLASMKAGIEDLLMNTYAELVDAADPAEVMKLQAQALRLEMDILSTA